jgi:Flp pilus assembly protein TadG
MVSLFLAVIMGFASLALDAALGYRAKRNLQAATDNAALAGAAIIQAGNTNNAGNAITNAVTTLANANNVTAAERIAGGGIVLGQWTKNVSGVYQFTSNPALPYNSVRIQARRTVGDVFAKIFGGATNLFPSADTIAYAGPRNDVGCLVPIGIESSIFNAQGFAFDTSYDLSQNVFKDTGNWGPLDLPPLTTATQVHNAIANSNCNGTSSTGDSVPPQNGAEVKPCFALQDRWDAGLKSVPMVLVSDFLGSANVNLNNFVTALMLARPVCTPSGKVTSFPVKFTRSPGSTGTPGNETVRTLVQ